MTIREEKVIVTMLAQESLKSRILSMIITEPWNMLFQTQMQKVLKFRQRPRYKVRYKGGNLRAASREVSSSKTSEKTGREVQIVEQPSIRKPLQIGIDTKQNRMMKIAQITEMIMPRWMTNCESTADLLQLKRPCHKIKFLKYPNSTILKSDASEACMPSLPAMPIPTSASRIIPTSLPPSPTAAILFPLVYFLIS